MSNTLFNVFPNDPFIDLCLYQYGYEQCASLHSYGPFIRNHYLFHYIISGAGTLISTNSKGVNIEYHIKSGQGFLISPKQVNTYFADDEHPWEYTWIEFDGLRVKEALNFSGLSYDSPVYRSNAKDLSLELKNEMLYIANNPHQSPYHLIGHLYLAIDYLIHSSANKVISNDNKLASFYVREAISYIEQNFQNEVTIENLANFCGLNRSYFGKIFRDVIGKSPQTFLISYRMTKAAELLRLTDFSICDISNAVGYPNQLHFSRAFKNIYHVSPRQWRVENKIPTH